MKKRIAVVKFGGTSLRPKDDKEFGIERSGNHIINLLNNYEKVIAVLSAKGKQTDEFAEDAYKIDPEPDSEAMDFLLSAGEQISVGLMGIYLRKKDIKCKLLNGWQAGVETSNNHTKALIQNLDGDALIERLNSVDVLVITGFQGISDCGSITTLGRGGSDTSAVALGVAVKAEVCEIITDVCGVYTANPNLEVSRANVIPISVLAYDEMLEMAHAGASVLDPRAAELAKLEKLNLIIRHNQHDQPQTLVTETEDSTTSVLMDDNISILKIQSLQNIPGVSKRVFKFIVDQGRNIGYMFQDYSDLDKTSLSILLMESKRHRLGNLKKLIQKEFLLNEEDVSYKRNLSLISVVGKKIMNKVGTMETIADVLNKNNINIIGCFTSDIRLSMIVDIKDGIKANDNLHKQLIEKNDD